MTLVMKEILVEFLHLQISAYKSYLLKVLFQTVLYLLSMHKYLVVKVMTAYIYLELPHS